jgi:CheY-like chemotaxis protein
MAHILIVEDEEAVQLLIRIILEAAGHRVYEARDGGDALDMLEIHAHSFDMIFLDVLMPKMGGLEFLSKLQSQPFRPPVTILSAYSDPLPPAVENLVNGRLNKPFTRQELLDGVNNLLRETIPTF